MDVDAGGMGFLDPQRLGGLWAHGEGLGPA
jgi:hypothetical protein